MNRLSTLFGQRKEDALALVPYETAVQDQDGMVRGIFNEAQLHALVEALLVAVREFGQISIRISASLNGGPWTQLEGTLTVDDSGSLVLRRPDALTL